MRKLLYAGLASILLYGCKVVPHKTEGVFPGALIRKDSVMYTPGTRKIKNAMVIETYVDYERVGMKNYYSDSLYYHILKEDDKIEVYGKDVYGIRHFLGIPMGRENYGVIIDSIGLPAKKEHSITLYFDGRRQYSPDKETLEKLMLKKDSVIKANNLAREKLRHASDSMKNIMVQKNKGTLYWDERRKIYVPAYNDEAAYQVASDTFYSPRSVNPEYINQQIQLRYKLKLQKED